MAKSLSMSFVTSGGKKTSISLSNVKDSITSEQASSAMDAVIKSNIFTSSDGSDFVSKDSAVVVDRETTELF